MKKWIFFATFMSLMSLTAKAQFDDVYYDPARDSRPATTTTRPQTQQQPYDSNRTQSNPDDNYVDNGSSNTGGDYYEYDDEYDDYAYSTRIRRFHRPLQGFDYYNNSYVDYGYYDPNYYDRFFMRPNVTIVLGNSYWNRYNRYNRWNNSIWFNRYWDDWCYTGYGFYNPYSFNNFYSPFGYSSYYSPYGFNSYNNWNDPYYNGGWGYNRYNRYNNPYQTGHTYVNTNNNSGNKYYGPRNPNGAIREVTGPSGQVTTGRRGDVGTTGTTNPTRSNAPTKTDIRNQKTTAPVEAGNTTPPKRYEPIPSESGKERPSRTTANPNYDRPQRTTETTPSNDRPTRTYERPAPNYDRPQRTTETTPSNDRPTRTYERPAPNYDRPQRATETAPSNDRPTRTYDRPTQTYDRPQRTESAPRYEAPRQESRQESRSYSPPASSPSPSNNSNGGGGKTSGGRSRND